jgi:hypothetical protein
MNASDLSYPIICIHKGIMFTVSSWDSLTTTTSVALRKGLFRDLEIIDSMGRCVIVRNAKFLSGIRFFWGYNIFFNRRIRVELEITDLQKSMSVETVKARVLQDFREWHGWESRGDFDTLKTSVENATTISEIIRQIM